MTTATTDDLPEDGWVRFWMEGDTEYATLKAAGFREAMVDRDDLKAQLAKKTADYERMWSALQAETATAIEVRGELRAEIARLNQAIVDRDTTIMRQGEEVTRLRAALETYAEPYNWFQTTHLQGADQFPVKVWAWDDQRVPWSMAQAALVRDAPATPPPPPATPS